MNVTPDKRKDMRDIIIPACQLEFKRELMELGRGEILEITINDAEVRQDLTMIAERSFIEFKFIGMEEDHGLYKLYFRKE